MKEGEISLTWEEEHTTPKKPGKSLTGADKSQRQKLIVSNLLNNFTALHESKMGTGLLEFCYGNFPETPQWSFLFRKISGCLFLILSFFDITPLYLRIILLNFTNIFFCVCLDEP